MRHRTTNLFRLCGATLCAVLVACDGDIASKAGGPLAGSSLRVLFTGETLGELEPCNCSGKMAGGLPRRAGYIAQQQGPRLLVDVGCVGRGARTWEQLRIKAALRAMKAMGYDAVNVGEHEAWLGRDDLASIASDELPFVSANVVDAKGSPAVRPFVIVERNGLRVAITGALDDAVLTVGDGLNVQPPSEAIGRLMPTLRERADAVVLLADLPRDEVDSLAGAYPEISLILMRGRGDSLEPTVVNRSVVASVSGEALYVGDVTVTWDAARRPTGQGEAVLLNDRFAEDKRIVKASIDWYKQQVDGKVFDLSEARPGWDRIRAFRPEPGNAFVGSESCTKCHQSQNAVWSNARHATAMKSLERVGYAHSPECVVCHVVGYGAADGYQSMRTTPHLGAVGCESCHGAGKALLGGDCRQIARTGGMPACAACHTPKHHPDFQYDVHWQRINHKEGR